MKKPVFRLCAWLLENASESRLQAEACEGLQARVYVENLRDEAEDDPARFRREVRTTLLHELGHYLGLEEDELERRGLA